MKRFLILVALATPALAQPATPYKLIVGFSEGGVTVIDYPTAARCERAKAVIEADTKRRVEEAQARSGQGVIISYGDRIRALCVPG